MGGAYCFADMDKKKKQLTGPKERFPNVGRSMRGSDSLNWREGPSKSPFSSPSLFHSSQYYQQQYNSKEHPQEHYDNVNFLHTRWLEVMQSPDKQYIQNKKPQTS